LTARTIAIRVGFALYGPKTSTVLILALLQRGQLTCLPSSPAMGNQDGKLPAQSEHHNPPVSDWSPNEMVEKEGGFRHQHGRMMARSILADNPKSVAKTGRLTRQESTA